MEVFGTITSTMSEWVAREAEVHLRMRNSCYRLLSAVVEACLRKWQFRHQRYPLEYTAL
jgi:hypothetical protein